MGSNFRAPVAAAWSLLFPLSLASSFCLFVTSLSQEPSLFAFFYACIPKNEKRQKKREETTNKKQGMVLDPIRFAATTIAHFSVLDFNREPSQAKPLAETTPTAEACARKVKH